MFYLLSTSWPFLIAVNFLGGAIWAGLGLGLNTYFFDAVQPPDRQRTVAALNIVNAGGWAMGTAIGSVLVATVPSRLQVEAWTLEPVLICHLSSFSLSFSF